MQTWDITTRPEQIELDTVIKWAGLTILKEMLIDDSCATVEFIAKYKVNGRAYKHHEISNFRLRENSWFYVDGSILS